MLIILDFSYVSEAPRFAPLKETQKRIFALFKKLLLFEIMDKII